MKKGCYGTVKLLRAEPGSIAAIMLMQAIYYLNTCTHPLRNQMRSFERFGL